MKTAALLRAACLLSLGTALLAPPALAQGPAQGQGQAQGQGHGGPGMPGHPRGTMQQGMPDGAMPKDPTARAYMDAMRRMNHAMMAVPMTGDADRDFAAMMLEHHKGAIDMARLEVEHGSDPELKRMAQKMIDDQTREVENLQDWLKRHPTGAVRR
ncbi:CopM family metallochaperone [Azospirillum thermophilum]|uniref:DUF305 domain-containing protein n=1 Tax=Azospirillum thermophilum TaxID=2202148 RepID=A0A2S2CWE7_9PROT|nr:DUF305 domain-containing protein [Azospirillum thermophilum]AWK88799.1 DUF305 domain-containing protein [Azospirillum thermophilum]